MIFLHSFHPGAIALTIGPLSVHWYGLLIVLGILAAFFVALYLAKRKQVDVNHFYNLFFYFIIFGLIGGRVAHVLVEWCYYKNHLADVYKIWQGGLAFYGVLIGCLLSLIIYCRIKKLSFWLLADILAVAAPLAQAIGRWGNYFNQEIVGKPTNLPWGLPIDLGKRPAGYETYQYFHPLFLYESIADIIIFMALLFIVSKKKSLKAGEMTLTYFILYSVARFFFDFLRAETVKIGPLVWTQWFSVMLIVVSLAILIWRRRSVNHQSLS